MPDPHARRIDEYHWLRDDSPTGKRPEVMAYLKAENAYTQALLAPLQPLQHTLVAEMRSRLPGDDSTAPVYDHGWWVWKRFKADAEHPVWMRRRGTPERPDPDATDEVLLDEAALAAGHAAYAVGAMAVSPDGRWLAWTEDTTGRRRHTLRIRDLLTGAELPERISGTLEALAWANDNRTLFYVRQDPVRLQSGPVMRHVRGTRPAADVLVLRERDERLFVDLQRSASGRFVMIRLDGYETSETRVLAADRPREPPHTLLARRAGVRHVADHLDGEWFIQTNEQAVNFRLVRAPEGAPDQRAGWQTLVPARADATLEDFALLHGAVALQERVAADVGVRLLPLRPGGPAAAERSAPAVATTLGDQRDPAASYLQVEAGSMVAPQSTWRLHLAQGDWQLQREQAVTGYERASYQTQRTWATARDGARVPVTLAWRSDRAQRNGRAPLLIEAYGAYGANSDPVFSSAGVSLMDRGVVLAIAHVRGGAELGQGWYEAGRLLHKKNSFFDFIDVTDHLVREGWGDARRVLATGASAGGLLITAVANLAGERYLGMAANVPFVDVVTTMLDPSIPLVAQEWSQWGDPRRARDHRYMLSYSPYDRIERKPYPAMLVTTGLFDAQVQYYEPAKYVARLRARKTDAQPLLFHIDLAAGHSGPSGRYARLEDAAREAAFFLDLAGLRRE